MEHTWKIGHVEIPNRVVVAPMAGITNSAFRVTVKEFGAGLVVCEMISDQGIHFRNKKTLEMLHIEENRTSTKLANFWWKQRYFGRGCPIRSRKYSG